MFFKKRKPRSSIVVTLFASAAFLAMAVYAWDVSINQLLGFLGMLLLLLVAVIAAAFICVVLIKLIGRVLHRSDKTNGSDN